jgi:hypothetical protein
VPEPEKIVRGVGWKKDPDDPNDKGLEKLSAVRGIPVPEETDLEEHTPTPYDQFQTSSCVGQSGSGAIYTRWGVQGYTNRRVPSQSWLYSIGRAVSDSETEDEGTYIRDMFKAAMILGISPATAMPFSPGKINERPTWAAMRAAYDQRSLKGYYRITTTGAQRVLDIKRALAAGHPVVYGLNIGKDWFDYTGGILDYPKDLAGGHATFLIGHYKDDWFKGQNSWSPSWGENGRYRIKQSAIAGILASDLWVIDTAPRDSMTGTV